MNRPNSTHRMSLRRFLDIASWFAIYALSLMAIVLTTSLGMGYRPVAITTGSMDPWAPTGALVIAAPSDRGDINVGDVIVMKKPSDVLVTHRVIELQRQRGQLQAITQGDANDAPDPEPYVIAEQELTGRFAIPVAGRLLVALNYRFVLLLVVTGALATMAQTGLRFIWASHDDDADEGNDDEPNDNGEHPPPVRQDPIKPGHARRKISALPIASALLTLLMADASYALYTASEIVANNTFSTLNCTAADGITLQKGSSSNGTNGISTVTINAVDPAKAFLIFSVNSSRKDPGDQIVRGELTNSTTISFERLSWQNNPKTMMIEWSVVEYACGVSVQRGVVSGNGGTSMDIPINPVNPASSFALTTLAPTASDSTFDANEMVRAEVVSASTVRLTSYSLAPSYKYGWQVIHFEESGVASVQKVATTFGAGSGSVTLTLPTAVDPAKTFIIASVIANAPGGMVGEQLVRARLSSATTVSLTRLLVTQAVDVRVQVITLNDGTVVTHGVTNLPAGIKSATAALPGVDTSIASAFSTVNMPGSMSGGSTAFARDDIVGEGSATFSIGSSTSLTVTRDSSRADASFGWQVVEWAK